MTSVRVAAVDLGASSGRVVVGEVGPDVLDLETVARFPNGPVTRADGLHWDVQALVDHSIAGLATAGPVSSIGIDAWAVDYGLLRDGELIDEPWCYRDERTGAGVATVHASVAPEDLYRRSGLQFLPFNTIYQLAAETRLAQADQLLLIPDLVASALTGRNVCERTNASTTGLLDVRTGAWDAALLELVGLRADQLPGLVDPGAEIGTYDGVPVLAVGSHDTASAVVGVPMTDRGAAYISCGTWGLVGLELDEPVLTDEARAANFTNEGGVDRRVRFLTNVMGTWLLSETLRTWGEPDVGAWLAKAAAYDGPVTVFDVQDPRFLPPGDMAERIADWCREQAVAAPADRVALVASIVRSLAEAFAHAVEQAATLSGSSRGPRARRRRRRAELPALPAARRPPRPRRARRAGRGDRRRQRPGPGSPARRGVRHPRRPAGARRPHPSTRPLLPRSLPMKRQLPKRHDLAPLMQFKKPELSAKKRRLDQALTIEDLRRVAKRRTPKAAFDYTDGAADGEVSLARAREAFGDVEFVPSILRDVSTVDTTRTVLGREVALPFGIAPTGFTRMMQTEGEIAGATAAAAAGIPFSLSTMGTTSIEDVAAATPGGRNWFQLYMWKDRDRSMALVDRAAEAGYDTLLVTVDVPVAGARLRDVRNGMTIPPKLTAKTVANAIPRPAWWFDFLTTEPLAFASLDSWSGTVADLLDTMFDPTVTFEDLAWIRDQWPGKVSVKGVQSVADAVRLADLGVDAVILSNHGGRQLDRAPVPFHLLPSVVQALEARGSDLEVHLDTGIMSGQDIVAAVAHGAHFTLIGRAYLYGLMAGGREGVDRTIEILRGQIERTMRLLGVATLDELTPEHVVQLRRLGPLR